MRWSMAGIHFLQGVPSQSAAWTVLSLWFLGYFLYAGLSVTGAEGMRKACLLVLVFSEPTKTPPSSAAHLAQFWVACSGKSKVLRWTSPGINFWCLSCCLAIAFSACAFSPCILYPTSCCLSTASIHPLSLWISWCPPLRQLLWSLQLPKASVSKHGMTGHQEDSHLAFSIYISLIGIESIILCYSFLIYHLTKSPEDVFI